MDECETENCGSRRFHVGDDGYTYCSESHRQLRTGLITINDENQLSLGRRSIRRDAATSDDEPLSKGQGSAHYLKCLQWLLRKQIHWLIAEQGCPAELETVIRNIWTLRLHALRSRIERDSQDGMSDTRSYTTQSDGESSDTNAPSAYSRTSSETLLGVLDLACLCYLGVVLLRLPITIADLHSWISNGEFIFYRSTRLLDTRMRRRLPRLYLQRLDPPRELSIKSLQNAIMDTLIMFKTTFGLHPPPINGTLLLSRWIDSLALPPECFAATIMLAKWLDDDLAFETDLRWSRRTVLRTPEIRLLCMLLTAVKLLFPLDGVMRMAKRPTELAATVFDWPTWAQTRKTIQAQGARRPCLSFKDAMAITDADIPSLSETDLDQYLDWYESNYIDAEPRASRRARRQSTFRGILRSMFPVRNSVDVSVNEEKAKLEAALERAHEDAVEVMQSTLKPQKVLADADGVEMTRPGSRYLVYRSAGALHDHAELLYSSAAALSGLTVELLVNGTKVIDRQLDVQQRQMAR